MKATSPPCPVLIAATLVMAASLAAAPIVLTGANGRKVEFLGVKDATPQGITVQLVEEGDLIGVRWDKLDLEALKQENALIYAAYEASKGGETIAIDLGSFAAPGMEHATGQPNTPVAPTGRWPGWMDTDIGGVKFLMQMPMGTPRGILLLAMGDDGTSFRFLMGHEKGAGPWGEFQNRYQLALLTYEYGYDERTEDVTKPDPFVFAEKGSGERLLQALNKLAVEAKKPEIVDLPIAVYAFGRTGAAFGYHFAHWKPERTLGAVLVKGAFYDAAPTESSAKVPIVFIWGQYSNTSEIWNSENDAPAVLAASRALAPNWTDAREYRGGGEIDAVVDDFSRIALDQLIKLRLPDEAPPPPKPPADEEGKAEGGTEEEKPNEEAAAPASAPIKEMDRVAGFVGTVDDGKFGKLEDPVAPLEEGQTFLPTRELAEKWRDFVTGDYEPPTPPPIE